MPDHVVDWGSILGGGAGADLARSVLPGFLGRQRWFAGKARTIRRLAVATWAALPDAAAAVALVALEYADGGSERYLLPVALVAGDRANRLAEAAPAAVLAPVATAGGPALLVDALYDDDAAAALLDCIAAARSLPAGRAVVRGVPAAGLPAARGPAGTSLRPVRSGAEQSNSAIRYGDRLILKLFRRPTPGPNPEAEIGRYLWETGRFTRIPPFAGHLELGEPAGPPVVLAVLQGLVPNEGDGWEWALAELAAYYRRVPGAAPAAAPVAAAPLLAAATAGPTPPARELLGAALAAAVTLGRRTAELHRALAAPSPDPAFGPEVATPGELAALGETMATHGAAVLDALAARGGALPPGAADLAARVLAGRAALLARLRGLAAGSAGVLRARVHGDYHLGQLLRTGDDFVVLDFEGEPARPLAERRAKHPPAKDLAGMIRSFGYAALTALGRHAATDAAAARLRPWAALWEQSMAAALLRGYLAAAPPAALLPAAPGARAALLDAYLVDKALYEVGYELDSRPEWVSVPLSGLVALLPAAPGAPAGAGPGASSPPSPG